MEELLIKGLRLKGFHGIEEEEKTKGQEFIFDIAISFNFPENDNIHETIDYCDVIREIERINKEPCNLLETLVKKIKIALYSKFKPKSVYISVKKNPPIPYSLEYIGFSLKE